MLGTGAGLSHGARRRACLNSWLELRVRGPFGDHTLCAMMNDLRVCARLARSEAAAHSRRPAKTCYRHLLGIKWSQVQILSARPRKTPPDLR
jgi:hypothetical protein